MMNLPRPGQIQPRDQASPYQVPAVRFEKIPDPPTSQGAIDTSMTGRQPYAGRDPMMGRVAAPSLAMEAPQRPALGAGPAAYGMTGQQPMPYGNSPGDFHAAAGEGDAASGARIRSQIREMVRGNGGMPAELEAAMRSGNPSVSFQSHQAGRGSVGLNPAGPSRGTGYESHEPGSGFRR